MEPLQRVIDAKGKLIVPADVAEKQQARIKALNDRRHELWRDMQEDVDHGRQIDPEEWAEFLEIAEVFADVYRMNGNVMPPPTPPVWRWPDDRGPKSYFA